MNTTLGTKINALIEEEIGEITADFGHQLDQMREVNVRLKTALDQARRRPLILGAAMGDNTNPADGCEAKAGVGYDAVRIFLTSSSTHRAKAVALIDAAGKAGRRHVYLSFQPPGETWGAVAAGTQDAWLAGTALALSNAAVAAGVTVHVALKHEPEAGTGVNNGSTVEGRDAWMAMQKRALPYFKILPNLRYGVILMGFHSIPSSRWPERERRASSLFPLWNLDACVPVGVDFVGFDLYQWFQAEGKTSWSNDVIPGILALASYCAPRGIDFGLAEFGISGRGFADPRGATFFTETLETLRSVGGSFALYFNTTAHLGAKVPASETTFAMEPDGPRQQAWVKSLRDEKGLA